MQWQITQPPAQNKNVVPKQHEKEHLITELVGEEAPHVQITK